MKRMSLLFVVLFVIPTFAQAPKPKESAKDPVVAPVLTPQEQLSIRVLEIDQMKAIDAQKQAVDALPQTLAVQTATKKLQEAVQEMFKAHDVDTTKLAFCDGPIPQEPLCKDVKPGDLAFRVRPQETAKK